MIILALFKCKFHVIKFIKSVVKVTIRCFIVKEPTYKSEDNDSYEYNFDDCDECTTTKFRKEFNGYQNTVMNIVLNQQKEPQMIC